MTPKVWAGGEGVEVARDDGGALKILGRVSGLWDGQGRRRSSVQGRPASTSEGAEIKRQSGRARSCLPNMSSTMMCETAAARDSWLGRVARLLARRIRDGVDAKEGRVAVLRDKHSWKSKPKKK
jgi:hypothetical protein